MWIRRDADGVILAVRVQPRASKSQVAGLLGDAVKIRLAAPPVDGAANAELVKFLAKRLKVGKGAVEILSGQTGRQKRVRVAGVAVDRVCAALGIETEG